MGAGMSAASVFIDTDVGQALLETAALTSEASHGGWSSRRLHTFLASLVDPALPAGQTPDWSQLVADDLTILLRLITVRLLRCGCCGRSLRGPMHCGSSRVLGFIVRWVVCRSWIHWPEALGLKRRRLQCATD